MAHYTKEDLQALYQWIPRELQFAMFSPETSDKYDELKGKFNLSDEQRNALSDQTGLLMLGVLGPSQYVKALEAAMKLPRQTVSLIAQDVNRDVLNPVKDALKIVHEIKDTEEPTASVPSIVSPPTPAPVASTSTLSAGNIFEQKLGGAFRIKSDALEYKAPDTVKDSMVATPSTPASASPISTPTPSAPTSTPSTQEVPPTPPAPPPPPAPTPSAVKQGVDPYRENI